VQLLIASHFSMPRGIVWLPLAFARGRTENTLWTVVHDGCTSATGSSRSIPDARTFGKPVTVGKGYLLLRLAEVPLCEGQYCS
jgi:hypothetical protein